jgi:hypothetical protein
MITYSCWQMSYYVQVYHTVILCIKYCSCQAMKQQLGGCFCNMSTNMLINQTWHREMNRETQNTEWKVSICKDISLFTNINSTLVEKQTKCTQVHNTCSCSEDHLSGVRNNLKSQPWVSRLKINNKRRLLFLYKRNLQTPLQIFYRRS